MGHKGCKTRKDCKREVTRTHLQCRVFCSTSFRVHIKIKPFASENTLLSSSAGLVRFIRDVFGPVPYQLRLLRIVRLGEEYDS
jgi:hypothetical protein